MRQVPACCGGCRPRGENRFHLSLSCNDRMEWPGFSTVPYDRTVPYYYGTVPRQACLRTVVPVDTLPTETITTPFACMPCELLQSMRAWAQASAFSIRERSPAAVAALFERMNILGDFCSSHLPRLAQSLPVLCNSNPTMNHVALSLSQGLHSRAHYRSVFWNGPAHCSWLLSRLARVRFKCPPLWFQASSHPQHPTSCAPAQHVSIGLSFLLTSQREISGVSARIHASDVPMNPLSFGLR